MSLKEGGGSERSQMLEVGFRDEFKPSQGSIVINEEKTGGKTV